MYVSDLALVDFRSYASLTVEFEPGVNALVGFNGQGKTNLVEALAYVATLTSHRVSSDIPLIAAGATRALIRCRVVRGDRASVAELEIGSGRANRVRINRGSPTRARDVLGLLHVVTFAPEDLSLVKGDPDVRRRFLDGLMVQLAPRYAGLAADYEKVVRQRSALLKSLSAARRAGATGDLRTLDVWDERLATLGAELMVFRRTLIGALEPFVVADYDAVSGGAGPAGIMYRPSLDTVNPNDADTDDVALTQARLMAALSDMRSREIERGTCLVGPHRDEVELTIGSLPARTHASHGESWSLALALRLASFDVLTGAGDADVPWLALDHSARPVLILDDVFAELDARRRSFLVERVGRAEQVFITAAVAADIPEELAGSRYDVSEGTVVRVV